MLDKKYQEKVLDAKLVDYSEAISKYHGTFLSIAKFHIKYDTFLAMQIVKENWQTAHNSLLPFWCPEWHTEKGSIPLT